MNNTARIMIAAPSSGSGKTTIALAIMQALKKRGIELSSCKCGPDYIDPMFHNGVLKIPSVNLDLFFSNENEIRERLVKNHREMTVIEGVMGYYDGMNMFDTKASSYEIAVATKTPVILVLSCRGMAYSAVASVMGMINFRSDSNIKGVILNNVTEMTYKMLKPVIEKEANVEVLGFLPATEGIKIKSRHLGLVTPFNKSEIDDTLERLGELAEKNIYLDRIVEIARSAEFIDFKKTDMSVDKTNVKIGIAYDEAFCFYYKENIDLLREYGAETVYFSPLRDKEIPEGCDGIILGGGYPELYAKELSENSYFINDIRKKIQNGMPCLAECGGYMYLCRTMQDEDKNVYEMAGVINADAVKTERLVRFGYINVTPQDASKYLDGTIKAHEFHYWDTTDNGCCCLAKKPSGNRSWECMHENKRLFAGFPHLYYPSNKKFAKNFLKECEKYHEEKNS